MLYSSSGEEFDIPSITETSYGPKFSCGSKHLALLTDNDRALMYGHNVNGELGLGDIKPRKEPTLLPLENIDDVSCGLDHTGFITKDNKVHLCGRGAELQLGTLVDTQLTPLLLPSIDGIKIRCGYKNTAIIDTNQDLWMCGDDWYGQSGGKSRDLPTLPRKVASNVIDVALGETFTVILQGHTARTFGDRILSFDNVDHIFARKDKWGYVSECKTYEVKDSKPNLVGEDFFRMDWTSDKLILLKPYKLFVGDKDMGVFFSWLHGRFGNENCGEIKSLLMTRKLS